VFLFTDKQHAIKVAVEWRVDIQKPFVGRFGAEILECFRSFSAQHKTVKELQPFSDDVMCATDRQLFIIYINS
jgi:hypothetical protein